MTLLLLFPINNVVEVVLTILSTILKSTNNPSHFLQDYFFFHHHQQGQKVPSKFFQKFQLPAAAGQLKCDFVLGLIVTNPDSNDCSVFFYRTTPRNYSSKQFNFTMSEIYRYHVLFVTVSIK